MIKEILRRAYGPLTNRLPDSVSGRLDWRLPPKRRLISGPPFNGQRGRIDIVQQILDGGDFEEIIETGAYRGNTTVFLRQLTNLPVYSVELTPRFFYSVKERCRNHHDIHLELGDSRKFLLKLGQRPTAHERAFFYLDAHWYDDLPLYEELEVIGRYWRDPVIMIDDFEVPDDPAYDYDDYGAGKCLTVSCLPAAFLREFRLFCPRLRGEEETGLRRGCVVAGRKGLAAERLETLPLLRTSVFSKPSPLSCA